jgi:hypothetical protein
MLSRLLALLFLFLPLLILFSTPMRANDFPIEIIEFIDNARVVAFIHEGDLDPASIWQPAEGAPKLSIESALEAVNAHITADPTISSAQLVEIKLEQVPNHNGYWNYLVEMQATNHEAHTSFFVVLMNGKVIPAVREPSAIK